MPPDRLHPVQGKSTCKSCTSSTSRRVDATRPTIKRALLVGQVWVYCALLFMLIYMPGV